MKCKRCGYESFEENDIYCRECGFTLRETEKSSVSTGGNIGGKKSNSNKSVLAVAVACAVMVCCVLIVCTVFIVSKGSSGTNVTAVPTAQESEIDAVKGTTEKRTEPVNDAQQGSVYEKETEKQEDEDHYNHKRTPKIPAGTRCRVDSYIDGSRSIALRPSPSVSGKAEAWAGRDNYVTVLKDYYEGDGEYIKISLMSEGDLYEGWVLVEYLHVVPDDEGIERTELSPGTTCRIINDDGLNLWKRPRKTEGSNGKAPYGATVQVLIQYHINDNGYVYVSYKGTKGWMNADYLEVI